MSNSTYLGLDLSTQQLKAIILDARLKVLHESIVDFDSDLSSFKTQGGVNIDADDDTTITSPVAMWLTGVDLLFERLSAFNLSSVVAISGAAMQHGTVYWSAFAESALQGLDSKQPLADQLISKCIDEDAKGALAQKHSPNWQDASTSQQCLALEQTVGGDAELATITGSCAHHRFSGSQIMKVRQERSDVYQKTARISLVSSFLASVLVGHIGPVDLSDATGMNLLDVGQRQWSPELLRTVAGNDDSGSQLGAKLGNVNLILQASLGKISPYFVKRYGFHEECAIYPFTGDNPATILSLPLKQDEAIISLGTSTTFLMSTAKYQPHPDVHFMHHPTTNGLFMFMLCYKNGSLAREKVRKAMGETSTTGDTWRIFDTLLTTTPILGKSSPNSPAKIGLYFPRPEILPAAKSGTFRALYTPGTDITLLPDDPDEALWDVPNDDARAIIESQFLSIRSRIQGLAPNGLQRVYLAGGAARNNAIAEVCGAILGAKEGIWRLENVVGGACAIGAANRAAWGWHCEHERDQATSTQSGAATPSFEDFLAGKWAIDYQSRLSKIAEGHNDAIWSRYGEALDGLKHLEKLVSTTTT